MQTLRFQIEGTTPLLMHRPRLADPFDPLYDEYKAVSKKRAKTKDDHRALADIEWEASVYTNDDGRPHVPAFCLHACIRDGGTFAKLGKKIRETTTIVGEPQFTYEGPKKLAALRDNPAFRLRKFLKVQRQGVIRTWPQFAQWGLTFDLAFPEELFDANELQLCVERAGKFKGLLESRDRGYGRFDIAAVEAV